MMMTTTTTIIIIIIIIDTPVLNIFIHHENPAATKWKGKRTKI